tara:strand:+ start:2246 stop:3487 length:1242 start_codon:yes stop_codon:yes gene_type:complete
MKKSELLESEWKKQLIHDLGLEKYNALHSKSDEGITIAPFYVANKTSFLKNRLLFPDDWNIINEIHKKEYSEICDEIDDNLINDINHIIIKKNPEININEIIEKFEKTKAKFFIQSEKFDKNDLSKKNSTLVYNQTTDVDSILAFKNINDKKIRININSDKIKNSGANIIQEIAIMLSIANEYLQLYGGKIAKNISFEVNQGNNYFFEIAKVQSLRILWSLITNEYEEQIDKCIITAKPSLRNKTIKNYNNNIIRATPECISGILGGSDFIKSIPYDILFKKNNKFSDRIKHNQLLILKNETYLDKVCNAIEGSYYIHNLIDNISKNTLSLFKKIEKKGGYINSQKSGLIFKEINKSNIKEQSLYDSNKKILVGFNKYIEDSNDLFVEELHELKKKSEILNPSIDRIAKSELS